MFGLKIFVRVQTCSRATWCSVREITRIRIQEIFDLKSHPNTNTNNILLEKIAQYEYEWYSVSRSHFRVWKRWKWTSEIQLPPTQCYKMLLGHSDRSLPIVVVWLQSISPEECSFYRQQLARISDSVITPSGNLFSCAGTKELALLTNVRSYWFLVLAFARVYYTVNV